MRSHYILIVSLFACGNPADGPAGPDSAAGIDAPRDAAPAGLVWECVEGCNIPSPLTSKDVLIVASGTVTFTRTSCPTCDPFHGILSAESHAGCRDIFEMGWVDSDVREATLCESTSGYYGTIEYHGYPGPLGPKIWTYRSAR